MLSRRDLLMSGALVSRMQPAEDGGRQRSSQSGSDVDLGPDLKEIRDAVRDLRRLTPLNEILQIQDKQRLHFKLNQKFPNYMDIGLSVWERLTMWHMENHLPLKVVRTPEGRMEMEFLFTTLVLRNDMADALIGTPYD